MDFVRILKAAKCQNSCERLLQVYEIWVSGKVAIINNVKLSNSAKENVPTRK